MNNFVIIELDDGLTIAEIKPHETPEAVALEQGGTLVDVGPYHTYEDAVDALAELEPDDKER